MRQQQGGLVAFLRAVLGPWVVVLFCILLPLEVVRFIILRFGQTSPGLSVIFQGPRIYWLLPALWWFAAILGGIAVTICVASRFCSRDTLRRVLLGKREIRLLSPLLNVLLTALYGYDSRVPPGRQSAQEVRGLTVLAALLMSVLVALTCVLAVTAGQELFWREAATTQAELRGSERAYRDYLDGKLRLYEPSRGCGRSTFTGRRDGPFEIWCLWLDEPTGDLWFGQSYFARGYNERMRYMQAHPERYRRPQRPNAKPSAR